MHTQPSATQHHKGKTQEVKRIGEFRMCEELTEHGPGWVLSQAEDCGYGAAALLELEVCCDVPSHC